MKIARILLFFVLALTLFFTAAQTLASPATLPDAKKTPDAPKTPGAVATQKADERATKQADKPHGKHEHYKGTIAALEASLIALDLADGSSVVIGLSAETRIKIPGLQDASVDALQPGMTAMVQAMRGEDDSLTARSVAVIPGKPSKAHHVGWVTAYTPGVSIAIQAHDGNTYTFLLNEETKILPAEGAEQLAVGARVTVIAPREVSGGQPTAKGIVVHPQGSGAGSIPEVTATP